MMFKMIRKKLATTISAWLIALLVPLLAAVGWLVVLDSTERIELATMERGVAVAKVGAAAYGHALERGVAAGKITMGDVARPRYTPFEYEHPTEIQRFHSGIDEYTDSPESGIRLISDTAQASGRDVIYAVGSDVGTHIPTTNSSIDHVPTGDPAVDNQFSRQKRKYLDKLHLNAARATELLVQPYERSVGDPCWDISMPVWVHGVHWGSFRVGISRTWIARYKLEMTERLAATFGAAVLLIVLLIWAITKLHTAGLVRLARAADRVSLGEDLSVPITSSSPNEVGLLAAAFNRMRKSVRAAMAREAPTPSRPSTDFNQTLVGDDSVVIEFEDAEL